MYPLQFEMRAIIRVARFFDYYLSKAVRLKEKKVSSVLASVFEMNCCQHVH